MRKNPHFVYLLKDGETVVYVGCTKDLNTRMKFHKKKVHNNVEVTKFNYKQTALNYERRLLVIHMPKYNWIPEHVYQFRHVYLENHKIYPVTLTN